MKKRVLIISMILCLIAIIGFGSLAYFQDYKQMTNMFAVAGGDATDEDGKIDPSTIFSIALYETKNGTSGETTTEGNTYSDLLPGSSVEKDPTVKNTGKYSAWIRMKVTITNANGWIAACQNHNLGLEAVFSGYESSDWERAGYEHNPDGEGTLNLTYYLLEPLATGETATLFTGMTIPEEFTAAEMAEIASFHLKLKAEAIQSDNNGTSSQGAFQQWDENMAPVPVTPANP